MGRLYRSAPAGVRSPDGLRSGQCRPASVPSSMRCAPSHARSPAQPDPESTARSARHVLGRVQAPAAGRRSGRDRGLDHVVRRHRRPGGRRSRPLRHVQAPEAGPAAPRRASAAHADPLHQHDQPGAGTLLPRRRGDRAADPAPRPLERGGDGPAGEHRLPRDRRPPLHVCQLGEPLRGGLQLVLPREGRRFRGPGLLPGPRGAGDVRARLPGGAPQRRPARPLPARGSPGRGPLVVPAPAPDARLLGVPDRQHGPGTDRRDLPGALQPLPAPPRHRRHQRFARLGIPGRRRDGRAGGPRRAVGGRPRAPRQPDLRRQLQPAAPGRARARQRQDHPGAGGHLPRRRLERRQGHLGREWDDLLARDTDGVLVNKMNETVDGEFQKYSVAGGAYIREHFFGPDPRLGRLVEHLSDDDLTRLRRGGHDYRKLYAAYKVATEFQGAPTVILAKTIKGWTLGSSVEGRNITHQAKKLSEAELRIFRDRLELPIPDEQLAEAPYYHPGPDSEEMRYLMERRRALGGGLPKRIVRGRPLPAPAPETAREFAAGSATAVSTTMVFAKLLRNLMRDPGFGKRVVPIIPDEARTFGMDPLFKEVGIYASGGQHYEPVDSELVLSYREAKDGQVLEEGITEAGSMASLQAAATSYATHGEPMLPFYIFYSMFGFQRTGDQAWALADARGRGFMLGATAGRTSLNGEGLQHEDGQSQLLASTIPSIRAYDPAYAYELATIIRDGIERMYGRGEDVYYYVTLYNENYPMPPAPVHALDSVA